MFLLVLRSHLQLLFSALLHTKLGETPLSPQIPNNFPSYQISLFMERFFFTSFFLMWKIGQLFLIAHLGVLSTASPALYLASHASGEKKVLKAKI